MKEKEAEFKRCIEYAENLVKKISVLLVFATLLFAASCFQDTKKYEVVVEDVVLDEKDDLSLALESCLQSVQNKCKGVIDYALTLEQENARLHKLVKELQSESEN